MPLHPTSKLRRERIMAYGGAGTGKSRGLYSIALRSISSGSDAKFFIIDTDSSAGAMLEDPAFSKLLDEDGDPVEQIIIYDVHDWLSFVAAFEAVNRKLRPQDWVMIDMLTQTWSWVQNHVVKSIYKRDKADYFLAAKVANATSKKPPETPWPIISDLYNDDCLNPILRCPGNIYMTAELKALDRETAAADTVATFGPYGQIPAGQKRSGHIPQTVLLMTHPRQDEWKMTTVKDRGRTQHQGTVVKDFCTQYILATAKWRMS